jgi:plasmid replication initiation protein
MNKKQQLVVKHNALINAAYRLDLTEQRLILMSTVRAREDGEGITADKPLKVRAEDYADQFKVTRQAAYMALKEATTGLFERQFTYEQLTKRGNVEVVKSRWVSQVSYIEQEGTVSIVFAPSVVPLITRLEKEFTRYDLEQVSGLKSTYAVRLYELLISWRRAGKTPEIDLATLRGRLGVEPDEYVRMHHFKAKVLDYALKQINEHTDITAAYEQHKKGRTISGFSFSLTTKSLTRDPNTIDMLTGTTDAERFGQKKKRRRITRLEAEKMAHPGEDWSQLLKRISTDYLITDLAD